MIVKLIVRFKGVVEEAYQFSFICLLVVGRFALWLAIIELDKTTVSGEDLWANFEGKGSDLFDHVVDPVLFIGIGVPIEHSATDLVDPHVRDVLHRLEVAHWGVQETFHEVNQVTSVDLEQEHSRRGLELLVILLKEFHAGLEELLWRRSDDRVGVGVHECLVEDSLVDLLDMTAIEVDDTDGTLVPSDPIRDQLLTLIPRRDRCHEVHISYLLKVDLF